MMNVLVLNAGSSSLKFQLIATDREHIQKGTDERICRGEVERIGGEAIVTMETEKSTRQKFTASLADLSAALEYLIRWIASEQSGITQVQSAADIHAVGHRVVHGGERFTQSAIITDEVLHGIEDCIDLAPLHNPNNVKCIQVARHIFGPKVPQVAVFDTAFHHSLPEKAYLYALPYHLYRRHHIRRYGFHGTSHRYVAYRYRVIRNLKREQTHVIDAAIVNLIATKEGQSPHEVEMLLNTQSGLLGVSGLTNDMRVLQQELKEHDDRRVRLAIEVFSYRARKYIGAFLACMDGADAVVFTGGIGENSADIRERICSGMDWAGLKVDKSRNEQAVGKEAQISTDDSTLKAYVIPTDEELLIARDTVRCISGETHPS
jgi:acetate kinase